MRFQRAALPSPAPVSEPTVEEIDAMSGQLFYAFGAAVHENGWRAAARAALALGARPPT